MNHTVTLLDETGRHENLPCDCEAAQDHVERIESWTDTDLTDWAGETLTEFAAAWRRDVDSEPVHLLDPHDPMRRL